MIASRSTKANQAEISEAQLLLGETLINKHPGSPPAPFTPDKSPTLSPALSLLRFIRRPPTRRKRSASTKVTNMRASRTRLATGSRPIWLRSKAEWLPRSSPAAWRRSMRLPPCSKRATTSWPGHNLYGGTPRLFNQVLVKLWTDLHLRRHVRSEQSRKGAPEEHAPGLPGVADQSADGTLRPSRDQRIEPPPRSRGRRRQHFHVAVLPAAN